MNRLLIILGLIIILAAGLSSCAVDLYPGGYYYGYSYPVYGGVYYRGHYHHDNGYHGGHRGGSYHGGHRGGRR